MLEITNRIKFVDVPSKKRIEFFREWEQFFGNITIHELIKKLKEILN
jgi:hypothetical protein